MHGREAVQLCSGQLASETKEAIGTRLPASMLAGRPACLNCASLNCALTRCPLSPLHHCAGKLTWVLDQAAASGLRVADWALGSKKFPRSENPPKPADA